MAKYIISTEAKNDLIRIYEYGYNRYGAQQAEHYYNALFECFESIAETPFLFEAVEHIMPGYRRCVCGKESIYYKITDVAVEIMAIIRFQDFPS